MLIWRGDILPRVSIVIPNWNGLQDTLECLESLERIVYPNYQVIVVDNGSSTNEAARIKERFPQVELIRNDENQGFAAAVNQGLTMAMESAAGYALVLNNDTVVKDDFLHVLVSYAEANHVGIVAPKILYYGSNSIWSMGGRVSYLTGLSVMIGKGKDSGRFERVIEPDFVTGCALLANAETVKEVGLFDATYFAYYEDADWCLRARRAGYDIRVVPDSIVWHKKSASAGKRGTNTITPFQAYLWARNAFIFRRKNLEGWRSLAFFLGQLTFRLMFNLSHCQSRRSIAQYWRGIHAGVRYWT